MREPIKLSTTFLVFFPNHLFLPECGWVSYCMEWEEYGKKFKLGREPFLEKRVLTSLARKVPKNVGHSTIHPRFSFSSPFSFTLGLLGAAGVFPMSFIPRFWLLASFSHGWEVLFVNARDWVVFLTIAELLAFTIHVLYCVLHLSQG